MPKLVTLALRTVALLTCPTLNGDLCQFSSAASPKKGEGNRVDRRPACLQSPRNRIRQKDSTLERAEAKWRRRFHHSMSDKEALERAKKESLAYYKDEMRRKVHGKGPNGKAMSDKDALKKAMVESILTHKEELDRKEALKRIKESQAPSKSSKPTSHDLLTRVGDRAPAQWFVDAYHRVTKCRRRRWRRGARRTPSPSPAQHRDPGLRTLDDYLRQRGKQRIEIEKDGNCFYRAVSQNRFGTQDRHKKIRQKAINVARKDTDLLYGTYGAPGEFLKKHALSGDLDCGGQRSGTWAEELMLMYTAQAEKINLCVYEFDRQGNFRFNHCHNHADGSPSSENTVEVSLYHDHYELLVPLPNL